MPDFEIRIDHYVHHPRPHGHHQRDEILVAFATLKDYLMTTQTELAAALATIAGAQTAMAAQVTKIGTETDGLIAKIGSLTQAVQDAGNATPEVLAALAAVNDQTAVLQGAITGVDDKVADAPEGAAA